ncbi:MAG TPA: polysaccharide deacetylase family protein [Gemmatimonadaceae bacterium]|jgi:peptidoglycan/xylan/chitin deacetylase (PgdA/CDA1 family)|nr:polysaccharide deacetylase family protein [Gemmatimonadaceae bacterium]
MQKDGMMSFHYRAQCWWQKAMPDVLAIAGGRAPAFVYGGNVQHIPVFMYHEVDASFERDLIRLRDGGYRTVGAEELAQAARGMWEPDGRSVAITFDDGDTSLTSIAAPLLERYQYRAIAFVVSGLVPDTSSGLLAGWDALSAWVARGVLEVGSHSLYHHYAPVSTKVVDIMSPAIRERLMPRAVRSYPPRQLMLADGSPILFGRPRYVAWRAFRPDSDALDRWAESARRSGAAEYGLARRRSRHLHRIGRITGTYESEAESARAILDDMAASIALIEARCPNPAARHLCYPWNAGDERTDELAGRAGAALVYKGVLSPDEPAHGPFPPRLQRLPADFLRLLPGSRRASIVTIARSRWSSAYRGVRAPRTGLARP